MKNEFDLVNHRLSWLIGSNSFMLAGFAVVINHNTATSTEKLGEIAAALQIVLPVLGLLSCVLVWIGILAAHSVINRLKQLRTPLEDLAHHAYGLEKSGVNEREIVHLAGNLASMFFPVIMFGAWATLLYLRLR